MGHLPVCPACPLECPWSGARGPDGQLVIVWGGPVAVAHSLVNWACHLGLNHVVVVGAPLVGIRQERARGLCFERLMWELDQLGISRVVFESRSGSQDRQDRRRVDGLRSRGLIGPEIRAEWRAGVTDPRLWVADAIVGVVGDAKAGGAALDRRLEQCIVEIDVSL